MRSLLEQIQINNEELAIQDADARRNAEKIALETYSAALGELREAFRASCAVNRGNSQQNS